jgi:hypothetical protein
MVNSLKDAFERARRQLLDGSGGKARAESTTVAQSSQPRAAPPAAPESFAELLTPSQKRHQREEERKRVTVTYGSSLPLTNRRGEKQKSAAPGGPAARPGTASAPRVPSAVRTPPAAPPAAPPPRGGFGFEARSMRHQHAGQ